MKSEFLVFLLSIALGFIGSFGGAHLLTDILAPEATEALEGIVLLLR